MSAALAEPEIGIGHNNPPSLAEILTEKHESLLAEVDAVAVKANAAPKAITTDEHVGLVGDVVKTARRLAKKVDDTRKVEKEPHLTASREVDSYFNAIGERIDRIATVLEARATEYQRAKAAEARRIREEEARKAREEEERQRQIAQRAAESNRPTTAAKHEDKADAAAERARAAAASAQASAADLTRTRSAGGTVVTTKTTWDFEILELAKVPLELLRPYLPRADIEKALRAYVKFNKDAAPVPGVRIFQNETASFR